MASLASNNEESRRQLTENSELINKIVELIQLKSNKFDSNNECSMEDVKLNEMLENDDCDFDDLLVEYDEESNVSVESEMDSKPVNSSLTDSNLLRLSSLCLLHSLSRSVHQLRTKFLDNKLWNTIVELINKIYVKKLKLNESNGTKAKQPSGKSEKPEASLDEDLLASSYASSTAGETKQLQQMMRSSNEKNVSNEEDDEDLLLMGNEIDDMEYESDLVDFSLNEKNLIAILFALVANLVIDFSPCKEVSYKK